MMNRPSPTPALPRALLWLVCALVASGCGDAVQMQGDCAVDADCLQGLVCHDARVCVAAPKTAHPVVLRLAPPPGQGMVLEHFDATVGGGGAGSTWQLTAPAVVRGTVQRAQDTFNSSLPGTLIATAPGKVAGTTLRYTATSYATPQQFEGAEDAHGFELLLQVGPTYSVTFWPDSDQIPPYTTELKVGGDTDGWLLKLPAADDLLTVTGWLVSRPAGETACLDGAPAPCKSCARLEGVRVMLVDDEGHVRSGRGLTDDTGAFEVKVDPGGGTVRLRFEPTNGAGQQPTGVLSERLDLTELRKKEQHLVALGDVDVGPLGAMSQRVVKAVDAKGAPVAGADVRVQLHLPSPPRCAPTKAGGKPEPRFDSLLLAASAPTDGSGAASFALPAGKATVEIAPPVGHASAWWRKEGVAFGDAGPVLVSCADRPVLRGLVEDFKKLEVVGAKVRLTSLDHAKRPPVVVVTDEAGRYAAPLDPGSWAVVVEPLPDRGLGRYSKHTAVIEAGQEPLPLDMTLPPPAVLSGRVLDRKGAGLAGVLVEVMASNLPAHSLKPGGEGQARLVLETHLLASGITRADGRFELLVETSQLDD